MPLNGQSSGGWTESSSALRILHVGIRNTVGILTDDAFTQTNPPIVTGTTTISTNVNTATLGVLSGSVAFTRPDVGSNYVGGPIANAGNALNKLLTRPLGIFINTAVGNAYENTPGPASGIGPYVSGMGTYASQLFETQSLGGGGAYGVGDDLVYTTGMGLMASRNGYLMPSVDAAGTDISTDVTESAVAYWVVVPSPTYVLAVLKMPADSVQPEIVFDLRV